MGQDKKSQITIQIKASISFVFFCTYYCIGKNVILLKNAGKCIPNVIRFDGSCLFEQFCIQKNRDEDTHQIFIQHTQLEYLIFAKTRANIQHNFDCLIKHIMKQNLYELSYFFETFSNGISFSNRTMKSINENSNWDSKIVFFS